MAKRILVPLDQGTEAESLVLLIASAARDGGGSVRLLRVAPVPHAVIGAAGRTVAYVDQEMARLEGEALDDLRPVDEKFHDVPVESIVRFGDPVEEIFLEADAFEADLIALPTVHRGRGWPFTSGVARRVFRKAKVPVLLLGE